MIVRTLALLLALAPAQRDDPILVSAAISLNNALEEIAAQYGAAGGGPVRFNFAGSNVLARQIVQGAPADLFISADANQMGYARAASAVEAPQTLLSNRLAVVTPAGARTRVPDMAALTRLRRIAIGDPAGVPAGVYARKYLETLGLWETLQPRLVPLANVRAALAAAESGGVDAAIVYQSDAAASKNVELAFVVHDPRAPLIAYPAAIVSRSANKGAAAKFLRFLRSREAADIFRRHRFCPAEPAPSGGESPGNPCPPAPPERRDPSNGVSPP